MLICCSYGETLKSDRLFQVALLQSLMQGEYEGVVTVAELKAYGDTGIGTFQGVNGEMIVLDSTVYRALWDGSVEAAPDDETVPFSNVTFFDTDVMAKVLVWCRQFSFAVSWRRRNRTSRLVRL